MSDTPAPGAAPVPKKSLGKAAKALRLLASTFDPRAWMHLLRMVNYWNYTHVTPRRALCLKGRANISPDVTFANAERIEIGDGVNLGSRCHLWAGTGHGRIVLGDDVLFGPEILVTAANYRFNDGSPVTKQTMDEADVIIGRDVWVGAKCVILPGARIGDGAIIGAGSVVRGEIPAMAIAAGVPARVLSERRIADTPEG